MARGAARGHLVAGRAGLRMRLDIPQPKVAQWWATERGTTTHGAVAGIDSRAPGRHRRSIVAGYRPRGRLHEDHRFAGVVHWGCLCWPHRHPAQTGGATGCCCSCCCHQPTANTDSAVLGTLHIVHRDDFKRGDYRVVVRTDDGKAVETGLTTVPEGLRRGWKVVAYGKRSGAKLATNRVQVLAQTPAPLVAPAPGTVLVTLVNFAGKAEPFTQAAVQAEFAKVAAFYNEGSYGKTPLTVVVTPWMQTNLSTSAAPVSNCDFSNIHNAAEKASMAQGYNPAAYQYRYFVWPAINCGWLGLGYVGYGEAYSNGSNAILTYAHELGHNAGLYHAGRLNCASTMTSCSIGEYGDPNNTMGNQHAGHFNGMQKALLTWIPPSAVQTHPLGTTASYTLHAIEGPQGNAVKIAESAKRTYWVEYRQPYGFDNAGGVFLYVSSPFETVCQTCGNDTLLVAQVTPAQPYTDSTITITVGPASPQFPHLRGPVSPHSPGFPRCAREVLDAWPAAGCSFLDRQLRATHGRPRGLERPSGRQLPSSRLGLLLRKSLAQGRKISHDQGRRDLWRATN